MRKRYIPTEVEVQQFRKAIAAFDPRNDVERRAIADTIVKDISEDVMMDDIINVLGVHTETFDEGQSVQFRTKQGMKAYVHEPGSYAPRSTVTTHVVTLATELVSVHPEMEIGQLKSGRYGQVDDLRGEASDELLGNQYATIWNTAIGAAPSSNSLSNYWTVASAATAAAKKSAVDSGFDHVADQPNSTIVAIVGRRSALKFLQDYSAYTTYGPSEKLKEDIDTNPFINSYRGIPVVMLNQYKDGYGINRIDSDEIMILGKDTVKMGIDRPVDSMEAVDVDTLMWHFHIFMKFGIAVVNPARNARIHLS